jgi:ribosomal protein S18 acetylase RimI-like enzyme
MTLAPTRPATSADASSTAALHAAGIGEGFLPRLGPGVLRLLHRRMALDPTSFVIVAMYDGRVGGFVAGTTDTAGLYRAFLRSDGVKAAVLAAPRAHRLWRRALETLRYPGRADPSWPRAELLAIAVDESLRGHGLGAQLTRSFQDEVMRRGIDRAKVVVAEDNVAAISLYRSQGFRALGTLDLHRGARSEVLVWP